MSKLNQFWCFDQELIDQLGTTINLSYISVAHGMTTELGVMEKPNLINKGNMMICDFQLQLGHANIC